MRHSPDFNGNITLKALQYLFEKFFPYCLANRLVFQVTGSKSAANLSQWYKECI